MRCAIRGPGIPFDHCKTQTTADQTSRSPHVHANNTLPSSYNDRREHTSGAPATVMSCKAAQHVKLPHDGDKPISRKRQKNGRTTKNSPTDGAVLCAPLTLVVLRLLFIIAPNVIATRPSFPKSYTPSDGRLMHGRLILWRYTVSTADRGGCRRGRARTMMRPTLS